VYANVHNCISEETTYALKQKSICSRSYRKAASKSILILAYNKSRLIKLIDLTLPYQHSRTVQKRASHNTTLEELCHHSPVCCRGTIPEFITKMLSQREDMPVSLIQTCVFL